MNDKEALTRFSFKAFQRDGLKAPHKPMVLLIMLARCLDGSERLISYERLSSMFQDMWKMHGQDRKTSCHFPFWYLQNDANGELWEVPKREALLAALGDRKRKKDVPPAILKAMGAEAGFTADLWTWLIHDLELGGDLIFRCMDRVMAESFKPSKHESIRTYLKTIGGTGNE